MRKTRWRAWLTLLGSTAAAVALWYLVRAPEGEPKAKVASVAPVAARSSAVKASASPVDVTPRAARTPQRLQPSSQGAARSTETAAVDRKTESRVSGRVVDATGGPIAGAVVAAHLPAGDAAALSTAESGPDGVFSLEVPPGWARLSARSEAYSSASLAVFSPARDIRLVLAPASVIAGRVVRADSGAAVAGARVVLENTNGVLAPALVVVSDEDGRFRAGDLAGGGYTVFAGGGGWRSTPESLSLGIGETLGDVELRAVLATELSGTISRGGRPCAGGYVLWSGPAPLFSGAELAAGDAEGKVQIEGLSGGTYDITVHCPPLSLNEALTVGVSPVVRHWDFPAGLTLGGQVRRASGQPMPGVFISMKPVLAAEGSPAEAEAGPVRGTECQADEAGEFECEGLLPGDYDYSLAGTNGATRASRVSLREGSVPRVVIEAAPEATIRVVPSGDAALPAGLVVLAEGSAIPGPMQAERQLDGFTFDHLPLGRYGVHIGTDSARDVWLQHDGEVVEVELDVPPSSSIRGRVVDETGEPVFEAWVRAENATALFAGGAGAEPALTDERGAFEISAITDGSYDLRVTSTRGEARLRSVQTGTTDALVRLASSGAPSGVVEPEGEQQPSP